MSSRTNSPSLLFKRAITTGLALVGTGVFWAFDVPLPFLFGPMTACLIAALAHAPLFLAVFYDAQLTNAIGEPARNLPVHELLLMGVAAFVGWKGGERIGLFGASILGPLILTAALSLGDFIHARPPGEAILIAQFFIGCEIGVKFVGVTWVELRRVVSAGVAYVFVLAVLAAGFTVVVTTLGFGQPIESILAFAPGGQAEMTVLAIVSGADLGFVITHHLMRIVLVIIGAPIAANLILRWSRPRG